MDLNLMDQYDPDAINKQPKQLSRMLDKNNKNAYLEQEVTKLTHLIKSQQIILLAPLKHYEYLFGGNIGERTRPLVDIPLKNEAKTYHARYLPITVIHTIAFKKYLDRIVAIGVLTKVNHSKWTAPSFIIPKKAGSVRFISEFQAIK